MFSLEHHSRAWERNSCVSFFFKVVGKDMKRLIANVFLGSIYILVGIQWDKNHITNFLEQQATAEYLHGTLCATVTGIDCSFNRCLRRYAIRRLEISNHFADYLLFRFLKFRKISSCDIPSKLRFTILPPIADSCKVKPPIVISSPAFALISAMTVSCAASAFPTAR